MFFKKHDRKRRLLLKTATKNYDSFGANRSRFSLHPSQRRTDEVIFLRQKKPQKGFSLQSGLIFNRIE